MSSDASLAGDGDGPPNDDGIGPPNGDVESLLTDDSVVASPEAAGRAEPGSSVVAVAEPDQAREPSRRNPLRRLAAWHRHRPRWRRRTLASVAALCTLLATLFGVTGAALFVEGTGTPSAAARSTGGDALWLGHG
jgi:hypothetical protein